MIEPKAEKPAHLPAAAVGQLSSVTISSVRPVFPPARLRRPMPVLETSVFQWTAMVSSHMSSSLQAALSIMMNANGQNLTPPTAALLVQTTHMKLYGTWGVVNGTTPSLETGPLTSGPAILTENNLNNLASVRNDGGHFFFISPTHAYISCHKRHAFANIKIKQHSKPSLLNRRRKRRQVQ